MSYSRAAVRGERSLSPRNSKIDALMVSPGKLTVVRSGLLETGEKASVYISANSDWTIEPSGDSGWITPSKTSAKPAKRT